MRPSTHGSPADSRRASHQHDRFPVDPPKPPEGATRDTSRSPRPPRGRPDLGVARTCAGATNAAARRTSGTQSVPRLYRVDIDNQRQNVTFVDYVRDRASADLHVLVTTQDTGGGGTLWVIKFIGLGQVQNQDRTFSFATAQRATHDDRRKEFARLFRIGLAGYAANSSIAPQLEVAGTTGGGAGNRRNGSRNFWIFRLSASGDLAGEQSSTTPTRTVFRSRAAARPRTGRLTCRPMAMPIEGCSRSGEDRRIQSRRDSWTLGGLVVKSLGGKAGAGFVASMARSSVTNIDQSTRFAAGVEHHFFPYSESDQHSLTVHMPWNERLTNTAMSRFSTSCAKRCRRMG